MAMKRGFTLIELSIVLVIIGLIVAGVVTGRDLIKTAQVRKDIANFDRYAAAANTFKLKYGQLPGDLPHADQYFSTLISYSESPWGTVVRGDGAITQAVGMWEAHESIGFFEQLKAAGLTDYQISGYDQLLDNGPGLAFPALISSPGSGWMPWTATRSGVSTVGLPLNILSGGNWWRLGYPANHVYANLSAQSGFSPLEMFAFDSKLDDGNGITGNVRLMCSNFYDNYTDYLGVNDYPCTISGPTCVNADGSYNMTETRKECGMAVKANF